MSHVIRLVFLTRIILAQFFLRACFNDYYKNQASDPIFEIMTRGCFFRMFDLFTIDLDSKTIYEC